MFRNLPGRKEFKMSFYEDRVFKTISGCNPDHWHKFSLIAKGGNSDVSKTINRIVEEFVYRWQSESDFSKQPLDRQVSDVVNYTVGPYYKNPRYFANKA